MTWHERAINRVWPIILSSCLVWAASISARAGTIDTQLLEQPWPKQWVKEFEVGGYAVRWRQHGSRTAGVFAGVRFAAPLEREKAWKLANDYHDIGTMTPGVTAVRFLEQQPNRQVIQIDVKVLWKMLRLTFEVEQEPPQAIRFRLANEVLGEYLGICTFQEMPPAGTKNDQPTTTMEISTWLKPSRPVPVRLLLLVERMTMLRGVEAFLDSCEPQRGATIAQRSSAASK